jgi:hypothetical protein
MAFFILIVLLLKLINTLLSVLLESLVLSKLKLVVLISILFLPFIILLLSLNNNKLFPYYLSSLYVW